MLSGVCEAESKVILIENFLKSEDSMADGSMSVVLQASCSGIYHKHRMILYAEDRVATSNCPRSQTVSSNCKNATEYQEPQKGSVTYLK